MNENEFFITVSDGTMLEVKRDKAKHDTIGVVHFLHGMSEHMGRYDKLVNSLNQQGYDVIRHNHRGHGKHLDDKQKGHIPNLELAADDTYEIAQTICTRYNDIPYIVIGHSMGSMVARIFAYRYPHAAHGLILIGTMQHSKLKSIPAMIALKLITIFCGKKRRMKWLNNSMYKSFNKNIKDVHSDNDWLSSDRNEVKRYEKDPNSGFLVSNQLIYQVVKQQIATSNSKVMKQLNPNLPILLISGKEDPLGEYGNGIRRLGKIYKQAGIQHITVQLYKNKRHEILLENDSETTWQHMYEWIEKQILKNRES